MLEFKLNQLERLRPGVERLAGHTQQLFVSQQGQPALCHCGQQADACGVRRFGAGQILRQGLRFEAVDPAKKVQLVGRDQQPARIRAVDAARAAGAARAAHTGVDRRPLVGLAQAQLRLRLQRAQRGHAQVAVVLQGGF